MIKTLNRFGGQADGRLPARTALSPRPFTVIGRRCQRCRQTKIVTGGKSCWVFRRGLRINIFTCAGCLP